PTTDFYNGATVGNNDGFPVIKTWDDPVQYSCQKNYIITMGDSHTWCDKRLPGGTFALVDSKGKSTDNNSCNTYTDTNGNVHGNTTTSVNDQGSLSGDTGITGTINGTTIKSGVTDATNIVGAMESKGNIATTLTGAGGASFYMAGLSAWAATNNIRPDWATSTSPMHVTSYIIDVQEAGDCAYQQQFWLTAKYVDPGNYDATGIWTGDTNSSWFSTPFLGNSIPCSYGAPLAYGTSKQMNWPKNLLRGGDPLSMQNSVNNMIQQITAQLGAQS